MSTDLLQVVRKGLKGRTRPDLLEMAQRLKDKKVSFSLLYHLSRDKYPSVPTYDRVAAIADDLRKQRGRKVA